MNDSVTINYSALAWLLWTLAALCAGLEWAVPAPSAVMIAAMLCVGGAATLHVRTFLADTIADISAREANAFEIGRDSVRSIR